ncbi:hybrid sensor histidine kinase/response regulator [bacterium]|nr:hybrid sensor histidine kinase/response regulator [bacterium]
MNQHDDGFLEELRAMFKIEAEEHIKSITSGLLQLEKIDNAAKMGQVFDVIFRDAHSLKGASRAVNLIDVETLCQSLESVFALIRRRESVPSADVFDILHRTVDAVEILVEGGTLKDFDGIHAQLQSLESALESEKGEDTSGKKKSVKKEAKKESGKPGKKKQEKKAAPDAGAEDKAKKPMQKSAYSEPQAGPAEDDMPADELEAPKVEFADTIRLPVSRLDSILLQAEDMLSAKLAADQYVTDLKNITRIIDEWHRTLEKGQMKTGVRIAASDLDEKTSAVVQDSQDQLKNLDKVISDMTKSAELNARQLSGMVNNLLKDMKQILMLPFSTLLKVMPKIVRDLSRDQGKEVQLITKGSTVEVDRRILEEMKDPFIHLFRNCIDHGLEKPDEREKLGKPRSGTLSVIVSQKSGDKIHIEVHDDGRGIIADNIKRVAVDRGIITAAAADDMSDEEAVDLIFQSDFSTSPIITDISGRGIGMAIVREKVEKLGGSLSVSTTPGKGTSFNMVLPVTVATFRGILVKASDHVFVIPTHLVERTMRIKPEEIKTVENRTTILIGGKPLPLVRLSDTLELKASEDAEQGEFLQIMVVNANNERIAFLIDEVQKEQEVLVKGLGKQLQRVRNIAGATVLGNGKVVPILNAADLVKSAGTITIQSGKRIGAQEAKVEKKSILIAEDSITSRTLIKNILTSAGYRVKATVDGMDAYTALKEEAFDLVVSDVEMPRMSGFELTAKIRSDEKYAELPVILVTGLETKEDRERGIDAGANAYIVKRGFDQSNLLEVIQRLI